MLFNMRITMISKNILFILSTFSLISGSFIITNAQENPTDFDPLVDIELIVTIETIRSLEKEDPQVRASEVIDLTTDPDFYLKLSINGHVYTSQTWENTKYLYEPVWQIIHNVPDDQEEVSIILQLWDAQDGSAGSGNHRIASSASTVVPPALGAPSLLCAACRRGK